MRRLRDKLLAGTAPLILVLLAATWLVQDRIITRLSSTLVARVSTANQDVDTVTLGTVPLLLGQARLVNDNPALREILSAYIEASREYDETRLHKADSVRLDALEADVETARASLAIDVGPELIRKARVGLMILTDLDGRVLLSLRPDSTDEEAAHPRPASLATEALVRAVLENVRKAPPYVHAYGLSERDPSAAGYMAYEGRLYLAVATPLMRGQNVEGVVLLGTARFLPSASDVELAYLVGDKVAASRLYPDTNADALSTDLLRFAASWTPPSVTPPRAGNAPASSIPLSLSLANRKVLALPYPLWTDGSNLPVAWAFLMLPTDTLLRPVEESRVFVGVLGGCVLLISALIAVALARRISRPIEDLSRKMEVVGSGALDVEAPVDGRDEVATLARSFNQMVDGLREKARLAAYVPEKARDAIAEAKGHRALDPKRVRASVLFSDLRGFTTLSEQLDPALVVEMLNEFLEEMQRVIRHHRGYISDYIGDAILAVFAEEETLSTSASSARRAVRCALEMQDALAELRRVSANVALRELRMGIGVNTGYLVEGDVGPAARLKYAVIGDTVNTAARIQDRSKEGKHTCILISATTREDVQNEVEVAFFGDEMLRGKSAQVSIWEVVGYKPAAPADAPPPP